MKKLGVIGGMGPEATSYYYDQVIRHTDAHRDQDHIDMIILSHASMPDRTQAIESGDDDRLLADMKKCVQTLEYAGCENIAIPCNTSHFFYEAIQSFTSIPIIHMPREAVKFASDEFAVGSSINRIGVMGTDGTIESGVYGSECESRGIEPVYPSSSRQHDVMSLIYDDIKAGRNPDFAKFERVLEEFAAKGCDCVILACTELSVLKKHRAMPSNVLDAMDVLVKESIVRSGAVYRV